MIVIRSDLIDFQPEFSGAVVPAWLQSTRALATQPARVLENVACHTDPDTRCHMIHPFSIWVRFILLNDEKSGAALLRRLKNNAINLRRFAASRSQSKPISYNVPEPQHCPHYRDNGQRNGAQCPDQHNEQRHVYPATAGR
mgnify:CR=1 FL=1